jgi:hypothetical protein
MRSLRELVAERISDRSLPCASLIAGGTAVSLRIQFANGDRRMFPWSRYIQVYLKTGELLIVFTDYEVAIQGKNLAKIMNAIEESRLAALREVAATYRLLGEEEPLVSKIEVRERASRE